MGCTSYVVGRRSVHPISGLDHSRLGGYVLLFTDHRHRTRTTKTSALLLPLSMSRRPDAFGTRRRTIGRTNLSILGVGGVLTQGPARR